ncbi:MAG: DNA translocase FtsK [Bacteroidaceae bacterium]|nr:DNA translocase FtsK [Bacteroidaceae bacterium]
MAKKKHTPGLIVRLKEKYERVKLFFSSKSVQFVLGVLCFAFMVFLGSSFLSFFSSGGNDQSVVESVASEGIVAADAAGNTSGKGGAVLADYFINGCFGWASVLLLPLLLLVALRLMNLRRISLKHSTAVILFAMVWLSVLFDFLFGGKIGNGFVSPGGKHGDFMTATIGDLFGVVGVILFLALTLLLFMICLTRKTIPWLQNLLDFSSRNDIDEYVENEEDADEEDVDVPFEVDIDATEKDAEENNKVVIIVDEPEPVVDDCDVELARKFDAIVGQTFAAQGAADVASAVAEEAAENGVVQVGPSGLPMEVEALNGDEDTGGDMLRPINPKDELSHYKPPTLDLLDEYEQGAHSIDRDEQTENSNKIINALKNFGIEISSIKASVGPTITLYEITPAPGVRINKIRNLEDDIAMNLAALCVRIVAPIPGKGTVGIEVPNAHKQIVPMASLLNSRKYKETDMALPLALGKTISNEVYMVDMAKMPHLLVAGATGMGKSVGLNAIITSLLYKMHPAYLKFVMVDPKMVELSLYGVLEKHFLAKLEGEDEPIITDVNKVVRTLKSLCVEMDNRYKLLQMASVRSVKEYNEKYLNKELLPTKGHRFMPYIVVVIDEYGDLMMTAGREVEQPIARIAQKARAVGIHMIIATQRPTTNIITGTIKANFPARMAFRVISAIDSRTILDRTGANQLQGKGDMLFLAGNDPVRVQCALVETKEVERVCAHIAKQQGYLTPYILPEPDEVSDMGDGGGGGGGSRGEISLDKLDPLFADAARVVVLAQHGSTSLIQRKLEIGFNRAGRIMDQLCRMGIVGEQEGSKPRQVLCADEADLEFRLKSML